MHCGILKKFSSHVISAVGELYGVVGGDRLNLYFLSFLWIVKLNECKYCGRVSVYTYVVLNFDKLKFK